MQRVSVKEARSTLKALLERVESGEEIVLLRRGKEVARLVPPQAEERVLPELRKFRDSLRVKGLPMSTEVSRTRAEERY